jgi:metal-responsive CopG/Arc/MetJ family transcriptional regulator
MKRATVTIPDELEAELEAYLKEQDAPPSLTVLMQAALRDYLQSKRLAQRQYRPARGPLRITPVEEKDALGEADVSVNHDRYFAEER